MIKFKSEKEMVTFLRGYRNSYYEWIALEASTNVRSPVFDDALKGNNYGEKTHSYNRDIERKEELMLKMSEIERTIEVLRSFDNQDFYRIMYFKFIRFKNLEEIACMLHYSLSYMKQSLYPKAKEELFGLVKL